MLSIIRLLEHAVMRLVSNYFYRARVQSGEYNVARRSILATRKPTNVGSIGCTVYILKWWSKMNGV